MIRVVILALASACAGWGALRVEQILQVPWQRAQSINSLVADANGNLIVTGSNVDGGFIKKLDASGNLLFTFSSSGAFPAGAAVDGNGDVIWIGTGGAPGFPFPFTKTVLEVPPGGSLSPGFVVKFHGQDGSIVWAAQVGAMQPSAIAVSSNGQITVAGRATTTPAITTPGAYRSSSTGTAQPLEIVRLSPDGNVVFAAAYGGNSAGGGVPGGCQVSAWFECASLPRLDAAAVLLDPQGHIWVAGSTNEIDIPVTKNALNSMGTAHLAEISADGSSLLYATYVSGDAILSAAMDPAGQIWLAGTTQGTGSVTAYDSGANRIAYTTSFGTQGTSVNHVTIGPNGNPVFAGIQGSNVADPYNYGSNFVASLNASGLTVTPMLRDGADAGLAFMPSGALVTAGSASVLTLLRDGDDASPSIFGVTNAALSSDSGQVSPGELISIFGTNLGAAGSTQVLFDGAPAELLYVSSTQINAVVPLGTARLSETRLTVEISGVASNQARLGVVVAMPGIFTTQDQYQNLPIAAALNEDGTLNTETNRAAPDSVVAVFGTGFGAPDGEQDVSVFGPGFLDLLYAGPAPGQISGVTQVNFRLPVDVSETPTILIFAQGVSVPYFTVWVRGT